jgi:hypothetical protein
MKSDHWMTNSAVWCVGMLLAPKLGTGIFCAVMAAVWICLAVKDDFMSPKKTLDLGVAAGNKPVNRETPISNAATMTMAESNYMGHPGWVKDHKVVPLEVAQELEQKLTQAKAERDKAWKQEMT